MVRAGIALFIAAGNNGVSGQIGTPGSAEDVITVGALDKNTAIAVYSSQGPTEEGRIKPNVAYMGSSIMSVEANSIDQYTGMSGTSMATPGAAGVAALMLQANPDLSPFDIRNIMQETATYRQCHYMGANEPCADDLIPKNRQNNVYGHGHVNALESVLESAEYEDWSFNANLSLNVTNQLNMNGHIHIFEGESVKIELNQGVDTVQWMSNDLRDSWTNIHSYEHTTSVTLTYDDIVHELEHLPDRELVGVHTLSMRALEGTSSSPLISFDVMIDDTAAVADPTESSVDLVLYGSIFAAILLLVIIIAAILHDNSKLLLEEENYDEDIADAELL
jgi:hypothetical protein